MEEWRVVDGTDGKHEVSNLGRVRNAENKRILKTQEKHGYRRINLRIDGKSTNCSVHRLVAIAFIPNPGNKPEVNHKDGVHDNNRVENLEWVTEEENRRHAVENGLADIGNAYYKKHGVGRYNRRDKPKAYLRKSEVITKAEYNALISTAESYGMSVGKLAGVFSRTLRCGRFKFNHDQSEIIVTDSYREAITLPYLRQVESLKEKLDDATKQNTDEVAEKVARIKSLSIGFDNDEYAIGNKRNHLEIVGYARNKFGHPVLVCQCDCGNIKLENPVFWLNDNVKSCGCMREDLLSEALVDDIEKSRRKEDWLYTLWCRQHRKSIWFEGWNNYDAFYDWSYENGYRPGMHLHRLNTADVFSPENCVWREKAQSVRVKVEKPKYLVNGEMLTVVEASNKYGIIEQTVRYRMRRGMTLEEAVNTPLNNNGRPNKTA